MFESLDEAPKSQPEDDPVTGAEQLVVFVLILLLAFGSLILFILLGNRPYGMQGATLITYSGAVFIWTFFRTRGVHTKHSLSAQYVREQLPRLLIIHLIYLFCVFLLQTWALSIRPLWLMSHGRRDMAPFDFSLMLTGMAIGVSQIVLCRRMLGRAKKESLSNSPQMGQ